MAANSINLIYRFTRRPNFFAQALNQRRHRVEKIADYWINFRPGLALIQRHERGLRVAVEGEDGRPWPDVIKVLRSAADADGQKNPRIDADARLANLAIRRQ